jgi:hypothetical protein
MNSLCRGRRLLVACHPTSNRSVLTVAGIGRRADLFHRCSLGSHCVTNKINSTGFYYVEDHAWGFESAVVDVSSPHGYPSYGGFQHYQQASLYLTVINPLATVCAGRSHQ